MARLLAFLIVLFPLSFVAVDDRGVAISPIVIHLQKNSPAYAAFEDMIDDYNESSETLVSGASMRLASGGVFVPKAPRIEKEIIISLKPMRIQTQPTPEIKITEVSEFDDRGELLPLSTRKERFVAALSAKDFAIEKSAAERAQELVEESLAQLRPDQRLVPTSSGGQIVVTKINNPEPEQNFNSEVTNDKSIPIRGRVALVDGAAELGSDSKWSFYRVYRDQVQESGTVNPLQAEFSIRVKEPKGHLVAEIKDRSGRVLGSGRTALGNTAEYIVNIRPTDGGTVASFVDDDTPKDARVMSYGDPFASYDQSQSVDVSQYSKDSHFFVEAFTPNTLTTVSLSMRDGLKKVRLFSKGMANAFYSIVSAFVPGAADPKWSTVWGRVARNGEAVLDARVEVAGGGDLVYFNELYIPSARLNKTTTSGEFAVVRVQPGVQAVRVEHNGKIYPARILPTMPGQITHVEMEIPTHFSEQIVRIFDVLNPKHQMSAAMKIVGTEEIFDLGRNESIEVPQLKDGFTVEVDAGAGFEILRTHLPTLKDAGEINLPAFSEVWMSKIIADSNNVWDRRLGVAVGFVGESDAEVELLNRTTNLHQTVYFDANYQRVNLNHAPAGGGFIKINLPLGFQTIKVQSIHSAQAHVESFVSEPSFLYLVGSQNFISSSR